jgi:hypothetical protein
MYILIEHDETQHLVRKRIKRSRRPIVIGSVCRYPSVTVVHRFYKTAILSTAGGMVLCGQKAEGDRASSLFVARHFAAN